MTDFLVPDARKPHVLVPSFEGFGAQYNQNLYAAISRSAGVTEATLPAVEQAVADLQPHFVRVFFDGAAFTKPDLMQSFARTLELAEKTCSTINVTFQGIGPNAFRDAMPAFAEVLHDAVTRRALVVKMPTSPRLVTIRNEPNAPEISEVSLPNLTFSLDGELQRLGVRRPLRLMGGDLRIEHQEDWLAFLGDRMHDLLDAYSVHIYWSYVSRVTRTARDREQATAVKSIARTADAGRKPLYVTEYGARGFPEPGKRRPTPGSPKRRAASHDHRERVPARLVLPAGLLLGYHGLVKWDAYFGMYDANEQGVLRDRAAGGRVALHPRVPAAPLLRQQSAREEGPRGRRRGRGDGRHRLQESRGEADDHGARRRGRRTERHQPDGADIHDPRPPTQHPVPAALLEPQRAREKHSAEPAAQHQPRHTPRQGAAPQRLRAQSGLSVPKATPGLVRFRAGSGPPGLDEVRGGGPTLIPRSGTQPVWVPGWSSLQRRGRSFRMSNGVTWTAGHPVRS